MADATLQNNQLCFVTVVFPIASDDVLLAVKNKISLAVADLPKVKIEFRFTEIRDNGGLGH